MAWETACLVLGCMVIIGTSFLLDAFCEGGRFR